jgi:CDP-paratose 2-epimerase
MAARFSSRAARGLSVATLANVLAEDGHEVLIYDALSRPGVETNLAWLKERHPGLIASVVADIRDEDELARAAREAKAVFHMAAQVAVTTSLVDPREDFEINLKGTLNLLDALRLRSEPVPVVFASTNKVYGDLADIEFRLEGDHYVPQGRRVSPPTGSARRARSTSTRLMAAPRARPTSMCWIMRAASAARRGAADELHLRPAPDGYGGPGMGRPLPDPRAAGPADHLVRDGYQVRDILDVSNAVEAYLRAGAASTGSVGRAFNLGAGRPMQFPCANCSASWASCSAARSTCASPTGAPGDQRYFVAGHLARRARALDLSPAVPWKQGVATLAGWLSETRRPEPAQVPERAAS